MPRYLILAKFTPSEIASRRRSYAEAEADARSVWESVGGTVEAWYTGSPADAWDVVGVVIVPSDALFAVANAMIASGGIWRSDFMELRTSEEADTAMAGFPQFHPPT